MEFILFVILVIAIVFMIVDLKRHHIEFHITGIIILCVLQLIGFWGTFDTVDMLFNNSTNIFFAIGFCFLVETAFFITLARYIEEKKKIKNDKGHN